MRSASTKAEVRRRLRRTAGTLSSKLLKLPEPTHAYDIERDIPTPMPDGVVLLGDRYLPRGGPDRQPVILLRSPYGRGGLLASLILGSLAGHGFQVFIQSTRGTFGSGGEFRPFRHEPGDGQATVRWLREQPWCDGRVATTGPSYLGHTQWSIAPYVDPPLVAASLHITASDITEAFYTGGGVPGLRNALNWSTSIGLQEKRRLPKLLPDPVAELRQHRALRAVPLQAADTMTVGAPVQFWRDFTEHELPGEDFWANADHSSADLSSMPPVNMVTGWWDLFVRTQLRDFTRLQRAGVPARVLVGPWLHGDLPESVAIIESDLEWFDHHLNGAPLPDRAAVRLQLMGSEEWLGFDTWPPPGYAPAEHRLEAGGSLTSADGSAAAEPAPPTRFRYDPSDPTPTVGGPLLRAPGKQADNTTIEARADVVTFTGPVLNADTDVIGVPIARIFLRTSTPHADLFVRLCDVDTEGVSRNVTDGILALRPEGPSAGADPRVGQDQAIGQVEVNLFPTAYRFVAGHRIRVQVSGGAFPRFARNFGTGERFATATGGVPIDFEIFHDSRHPSAITLPTRSEALTRPARGPSAPAS